MNRTRNHTLGMIGITSLALAIGGCVSYTNVPVPESAPAFQSANHRQSITVISRALEAVIMDHPVVGEYAINLPAGTTPETAQKIVTQLPIGAIVPFEGMDESIPVYSIGRVWIRASDAKVDVVYPFMRADGASQDQSVTVWLNGGIRTWRVNRQQHWSPGTVLTPPVYVPVWPEPENVDDTIDESDMESTETHSPDMYQPELEEVEPIAEPVMDPEPVIEEADQGALYRQVPVGSGE